MKTNFLKTVRTRYRYSFYFALIPFVINLIAFIFNLIKFDPFLYPITSAIIFPLFLLSFLPQILVVYPLLILIFGDKNSLLFNIDPIDIKVHGIYTPLGEIVASLGGVFFYLIFGMIVGLIIEKFRNRKRNS